MSAFPKHFQIIDGKEAAERDTNTDNNNNNNDFNADFYRDFRGYFDEIFYDIEERSDNNSICLLEYCDYCGNFPC
jgi:hypothetical protein